MNLEDKIKHILQVVESKEDKKESDDDKDLDKDDLTLDVDKADTPGETDVSTDNKKKDDIEVKEEKTLSTPSSGDSKDADNTKIKKAYKTDSLEKLKEPKGGDTDPKAEAENKKITKDYTNNPIEKLSATAGMKEDTLNAMFEGENLTEEFKDKAKIIFEAAVEHVADKKVTELQEEYQLRLDEAVEDVKGELVENIDKYLDAIVEQWIEQNEVALENGIKNELAASFISNLKTVFEENYIDIPDSKFDVLAEQSKTIESLKSELETVQEANDTTTNEIKMLKCEAVIKFYQKDLTIIEAEKLYDLAENVEFTTEKEFDEKVKVLKESFFKKVTQAADNTIDTTNGIQETTVDSEVAAVLKALRTPNSTMKNY